MASGRARTAAVPSPHASCSAAHLVGVLTVVTHHLKALVWNELHDRRDGIKCREHLKFATDLRVHSGALKNQLAGTIHMHLRLQARIGNNVLRKSLSILTLMRHDASTAIDLKSRVHPNARCTRSLQRHQSIFDQERNNTHAEQLLKCDVISGNMRIAITTVHTKA